MAEAIYFSTLATEAIGATALHNRTTRNSHLGGNERRERSAGNKAHDVGIKELKLLKIFNYRVGPSRVVVTLNCRLGWMGEGILLEVFNC